MGREPMGTSAAQIESASFRDLRRDELDVLGDSIRESSDSATKPAPRWMGGSARLSAAGAGLVLLAVVMPQWLVDAINVRQMRALDLPASMDMSLYENVGTWAFGLRAAMGWLGVVLAALGWRASVRQGTTDFIAPPTIAVGFVVAALSSWLSTPS